MEGAEFELLVPQSALNICSYKKNQGVIDETRRGGDDKTSWLPRRHAVA